MIIEIKCPDCGEKHFFDAVISGNVESIIFGGEEELRQFLVENVQIRGIIPSHVIAENI